MSSAPVSGDHLPVSNDHSETTTMAGPHSQEKLTVTTNEKSPATTSEPESQPAVKQHRIDGGWEAWSVVAGASVALFVQFGLGNSFGTFQQYYSQHQLQGFTPEQVSWIGSVELFLIFFPASFCGRFFDLYGPRFLMIGGSVLVVLSLFLVSAFQKYYQLMICQGVLLGLGSAMLYNPSVSVMGQWFHKKRAAAAGVIASGAALGGVIFPIMFSRLVGRIGFGWTVRAIAFMSMGLLAISIATVKARLPPRSGASASRIEPVTAFANNAAYRWLVISTFFAFWGLWTPFIYIGDFSVYRGFNSRDAFYVLPIANAASVVGRLAGFIGDKIGRFNMYFLVTFLAGIINLTMWTTVSGPAAIYVYAILFGLFSGGVIAIFPACTAQVSPPELIGSRLGFLLFVMSFATLTGAPIGGALLKYGIAKNAYIANAAFSGATMIVGAFFALLAKFSIHGSVMKSV
ncbi:putative monocarboxylate permease [Cyathus striatus]|nr:putative monocarboxylate permease [Cyathus striatus]